MQISPADIIRDFVIVGEDFTQKVAMTVKVKKLPTFLRDNIINQQPYRKSYRAIAKPLYISVRAIDLIICDRKEYRPITNHL